MSLCISVIKRITKQYSIRLRRTITTALFSLLDSPVGAAGFCNAPVTLLERKFLGEFIKPLLFSSPDNMVFLGLELGCRLTVVYNYHLLCVSRLR